MSTIAAMVSACGMPWFGGVQAITRRTPAVRAVTMLIDRKSTRLNSSHTEIYTLSLHDALPIYEHHRGYGFRMRHALVRRRAGNHAAHARGTRGDDAHRSEEHTSELQSHRDLHSFPTRRSSDL